MPFDGKDFALPSAVETDETLQRLIEARAMIARGWCKDALNDDKGSVCIVGALHLMSDGVDRGLVWGSWSAMTAQIPGGVSPPTYNNDPNTTHADVIAVFDRAIAARRGELS
jgi:hypothetical protein